MSNLTDALWKRYREQDDQEARSQLLDRYLGLVHHSAREIANRVGGSVEVNDLVSAGTLGLVKALESFDLSRGLAFSTYAMRRIRGAILDELRAIDWLPRSVRSKGRKLTAAVNEIERRLERPAEHGEIADSLGLDMNTYWKWREEVGGGTLVSLDGSASTEDTNAATLAETVSNPDAISADDMMTKEEGIEILREAITELPPRERTVLALYYYEEMNLRQIAEVMHVTESRISQIRSQAIKRLRTQLARAEVAQ